MIPSPLFFLFVLLAVLLANALAFANQKYPEQGMVLDVNLFGETSQSSTTCYGGMIDAGSSGSRLYVYKWPCRQKAVFPQIDITQVAPNQRITPGISSFANSISSIEAYLNPLFTFAKQNIPSNVNISSVPLFMRATAGMRLLTLQQQTSILNETIGVMKNSGFFVENNAASVITGQQEGAYGFIALNYLNGKFQAVSMNSSVKTTPITDMGGASMQLTFETSLQHSFEHSFNLTISGLKSFILYTYSYLNYGNDQARWRVTQLAPVNSENQLLFPCFLQGYVSNNTFANPLQQVLGTGNVTECIALIDQFLNISTPGASINGNYQPPIPLDEFLYGTNSFRFASEFFGFKNGTMTSQELYQAAATYCALDYETAFFNSKNSSFAYSYCFLGLYITRVVEKGFGYPSNQTISITAAIQNNEVTYAMGAMIHDIALLPCDMEGCTKINPKVSEASNLFTCKILFFLLVISFIV